MILAGITSVYQQGGAKRKHQWDEHATNKFRINPTGPTSVSMKPLPDYKPTGYNIKRGVERPINFDDLFRNKESSNQQLAQKFPQYVSNPGMGAMNITTLPTTGTIPSIPPVDTRLIKKDSEDVFYDFEDIDIKKVKEEVKEEKRLFKKALDFISEAFFEKDDSTDNDDPDYEPSSSSDVSSNISKTFIDELNQMEGERKENLKQLVLSIAKKYVDEQKQKKVKEVLEKPKISKKDSKQITMVIDPFIASLINENNQKGFKLSSSKDRENQLNTLKLIFGNIGGKKDSLGNLNDHNFKSKSKMPSVVATTNTTTTEADTNFKNPNNSLPVVGSSDTSLPNVVAPKNQTSSDSTLSPISEETIDLGNGTMNPKTYNLKNLNDVQEIADRFPEDTTNHLNERITIENAKKFNLEQEKKNAKREIEAREKANQSFRRHANRKVIKKRVGVNIEEATKSLSGGPTSQETLSPPDRIISSKRQIKTPPKPLTFAKNLNSNIIDFRSDYQKEMDYINAPLTSPDSSGSEYGVKVLLKNRVNSKGQIVNKGKGKKK